MKYVIVHVADTGIITGKQRVHGKFLQFYDPDFQPPGHEGQLRSGYAEWTDSLDDALKFASANEAWVCWRQQSTKVPTRIDGQPNRPLTAYTIEVLSEDAARRRT